MNANFGTLENNTISYAPSSLKIGGILYTNPTKEQYLSQKYKQIVNNYPETKEGYNIVFKEYTQDETSIYYNYDYEKLPDPEKETFQVSKLYLRIALSKIGLWEKVQNWMESFDIDLGDGMLINCYDAYKEALVLDTGNALFEPYLNLAKEQFKDYISSEDVDKMLKECEAK